jgi:hypothetical protein
MDLSPCPQCTEEVTSDSDFCPHCGVLFDEAGDVMCDLHPQIPAQGVCIICRNVVCPECGFDVLGRVVCAEHKAVTVQEDWAEVYQSTDITEAELIKSVLEVSGHKVQAQNFNSIGFIWDGGGDSSISRSNINKPAQVFVPIPEYIDAKSIVAEWLESQADVHLDEQESEQ